jgi:hypothetical protein
LNLIEDILSTYYKCTISAITHKLNVSGHMLIWTFFSCFGAWNSCPNFVGTFQLHPVYIRKYMRDQSLRSWLERRVRLSTACDSRLCAADAMKSRSGTAGTSPGRHILTELSLADSRHMLSNSLITLAFDAVMSAKLTVS